ncbi:hypothetical protein F5Y06DRAFT_290602 [Hypoxylon sp. FL0890]|nr:hypothetical protein F5Y06DRAFT_290602 [Hypoxylon sp. FL0890]
MHALWSRAAQAQSSCRCRICLHSGRSIVRRSTNAASRRKISAADIFTACYTTILGTATILDAQRKEARKKELDEKLEKARAALGNLGVQEAPGQQGEESNDTDAGMNILETRNFRSGRNGPGASTATNALLQELGAICEITRRPLPRPSWLQTQLEWAQVEAAITAEERDPDYQLREPKSSHQLQRTTATVLDLVNRLIWRSQTGESIRVQDNIEMSRGHTSAGDMVLKELQDVMQTSHYPSYRHPSEDVAETARSRSLLGESIRRIFNQAASSKEIVAKICYNIITSSAPPSIHIYNTLIAGFNRIRRPDLAEIVIDSYLHSTPWPATQQTMVCLLNHYRGTDHVEGLRDIIQRMRGVKGTGLHFRVISKHAVYTHDWLAWAMENCALRKHTYVERAKRGDDVFNSIIKSWLYCGELDNASRAFVACLRNGGSVPIQTLQELLKACLSAVYYPAARRLIQGFVKNIWKFAALVNRVIEKETIATSRQVVLSLSHLLEICWLPSKNIIAPIAKVYHETLLQLESFLNRVRFELELRETANLCTTILKEIKSSDLLICRLERAIATLDSSRHSREKVTGVFANFSRLTEVLSIDRRYHGLETAIETTTTLVKATVLKIKTGYDLDPSALLTSNSLMSFCQQTRRYSILNALRNIEIHRGPMTQEDIRLQLFRCLPDPMLARKFEESGAANNLTIRTLITLYGPKPTVIPGPQQCDYSKSIIQLEQELADAGLAIRATLFAHLNCHMQGRLGFKYPYLHTMPIKKLVEYHMRRRICEASRVTETQQTNIVESREQEDPAIRTTEESSMVLEDTDKANDIVPRRPATKHADIERGLHIDRPTIELPSADPSVLRDDGIHSSLAATG